MKHVVLKFSNFVKCPEISVKSPSETVIT